MPRGADAVVMIEHTELIERVPAIEIRRARRRPGSSSPMPAPTSRAARRCCARARRSARARSACWRPAGSPRSTWCAGRRSRCSRPATNWCALGDTLRPGGVYDSNGAILAAAIAEAGGEPVAFGAFPDDEAALEQAVRRALAECDMVVLSGGTSKGAGDLSHRIVSKLGAPGILVHGVALKPGKPLCLAVADGKPIAVLPGFPDLGDLHLPRLRRAGDPRPRRAAAGGRARRSRRACRCASPRRWAARSSCWCRWSPTRRRRDRVSLGQGLRRGDELLAGRRLHRDRRAGRRARRRHQRARHADRPGARRRPTSSSWAATTSRSTWWSARWPSADFRARTIAVGSQGGVDGGAARRMRRRAGASGRSRHRHLQQAPAGARPVAGQRLAAHAGRAVPAGRPALRGQDRGSRR